MVLLETLKIENFIHIKILNTSCLKESNLVYSQYSKSEKNHHFIYWGFPDISNNKESVKNAGDPSLTPESGRSSGDRNGYPFQ